MFKRLRQWFWNKFNRDNFVTFPSQNDSSEYVTVFTVANNELVTRQVSTSVADNLCLYCGYERRHGLQGLVEPASIDQIRKTLWSHTNDRLMKVLKTKSYEDTRHLMDCLMNLSELSGHHMEIIVRKYLIELRTIGVISRADIKFAIMVNQISK